MDKPLYQHLLKLATDEKRGMLSGRKFEALAFWVAREARTILRQFSSLMASYSNLRKESERDKTELALLRAFAAVYENEEVPYSGMSDEAFKSYDAWRYWQEKNGIRKAGVEQNG